MSWTSGTRQTTLTTSRNRTRGSTPETVSYFHYKIIILTLITLAETDFKLDAVSWPGRSEQVFSSEVTEADTCPTRTSVLALSVVCALLLVLYICTMFYFCMRKVILQNQKV